MTRFIKKYFLGYIPLWGLTLIFCPISYALPIDVSTNKYKNIKYDQKKIAISLSLKGSHKCETFCAPDSLGCSKKKWLSRKDKINSTDRVHWRKICKMKISLCKKKCSMDREINANQ